jgi:hypothetical protein
MLSDRLRQISAKIAIFLAWIASPVALVPVANGATARPLELATARPNAAPPEIATFHRALDILRTGADSHEDSKHGANNARM